MRLGPRLTDFKLVKYRFYFSFSFLSISLALGLFGSFVESLCWATSSPIRHTLSRSCLGPCACVCTSYKEKSLDWKNDFIFALSFQAKTASKINQTRCQQKWDGCDCVCVCVQKFACFATHTNCLASIFVIWHRGKSKFSWKRLANEIETDRPNEQAVKATPSSLSSSATAEVAAVITSINYSMSVFFFSITSTRPNQYTRWFWWAF